MLKIFFADNKETKFSKGERMTRLRPRDIKGSTEEIHELEALLNRELGANLDVNQNHNLYCRNELMAYLNENNFRQHEGTNVNRSTIEQFIDRILTERNQNENINLDFLQPTKVMQQATRYDNIPTERLLGIYNERFDSGYTHEGLLSQFDNNEQEMRKQMIEHLVADDESEESYIRSHSSPPSRSLVGNVNPIQWRGRTGTKIAKKPGMKELQNIVLNLYRDVVRVKNAISPQGADEIVKKHNAKSKPEAHWRLETDDVNADGIPDIIIKNARGDPMYVNGYTTKKSDYPETFEYYSKYPTKFERKTMPKRKFIKEQLYGIETRYDSENLHEIGDMRASNRPEWYDTARKKYRLTNIDKARLSPYRRFQTFIVQPKLNDILEAMKLSNYPLKGPLLAKVTSSVWNNSVVIPIAQANGVRPEDLDKFRKSKAFKELSDQKVTEILGNARTDPGFANDYEDEIAVVTSDCMKILDADHSNPEAINFLD